MRTAELDLTDDATAEQLLALQAAAYAVEARLIGDDRIPPLHETLPDLRAAGLRWLGTEEGGRLVAAVAWVAGAGLVDVHRLVVDPARHGRGLGRALVTELLTRTTGRVVASTGRDNAPARGLYRSLGFVETGDVEVLPGLWTTGFSLERSATSSTSCPSPSSR